MGAHDNNRNTHWLRAHCQGRGPSASPPAHFHSTDLDLFVQGPAHEALHGAGWRPSHFRLRFPLLQHEPE
eukprot:7378185-Lingulodinium_polyedra.AAC.1